MFGPLGKATWRAEEEKDLLCIAGGSGVAGMMSILSHAVSSGHFERRRGDVFFGVRTREDVFFDDELARLVESAAGRLTVTIAFSDEQVVDRDPRIPRCIDTDQGFVHLVARERMAGEWNGPTAFVAGPPPMVDAALRMLVMEARLAAVVRTQGTTAHAPSRLGSPAPSTPLGPDATVCAPPKNMFGAFHNW